MILCAVPRDLVTTEGSTWQVAIKVKILNNKLFERALITVHNWFSLEVQCSDI